RVRQSSMASAHSCFWAFPSAKWRIASSTRFLTSPHSISPTSLSRLAIGPRRPGPVPARGDQRIRTLATPTAFDCLNDGAGGHANGEEYAAQLNHHGCLRNMAFLREHEETQAQAEGTQDH